MSDLHCLGSEMAVLGAVMNDAEALDKCGVLRAEHFHEPVHGLLFDELRKRIEAGRATDAISLQGWWAQDAARLALDEAAGTPYLVDLQREAPWTESVGAYADTIREMAERRAQVEIAKALEAQSADLDVSPREALESAERELASLAETGSTGRRVVSAAMALQSALSDTTRGLPSGWADFDRKFLGWRAGRLYVAAGRPGMGKSLFGAGCALEQARRGKPVAFVSLEMSAEEVSVRLAATLSGVPYSVIERDGVPADRREAFAAAQDTISRLPMTILDMPGASVGAIRNALRRLDRDFIRRGGQGLALAVVDYLGLVSSPAPGMGLYEATTRNSQTLKQAARELGLPMLVLAQLSRGVEQRGDKHPMLSDLRDSGAIEQDADAVFGLYREAYYAQQEEPDANASAEELLEHERKQSSRALDVDILKQRGGETGRVPLYCDPATGIIQDKARDAA